MGSTLDDLCKLLHIKDSSDASKRSVTYEKAGQLCFLMAQLETTTEALRADDEESLGSCIRWVQKGVDCYLKSMSEYRQEDDAWKRLNRSLISIVDWITSEDTYSLMKAFCKSINEGPPCDAAAEAYMHLGCILYRRGADVIRGFSGRFENNDYKACFSWMTQSLEPYKRSMNLYHSLHMEQEVGIVQRFIVKTQIAMNTMKTCIELVDLISKLVEIQDLNVCLRSWFNDCQEPFESLALIKTYRGSTKRALNDLKNALHEPPPQHILQIFFKTFHFIMVTHYCDSYSFSFEKSLSIFFTAMEKHEARIEVEETDTEILLKLEDKIRALCLEGKKSCAESYLRYVYEEHPHPNPKWKMGSISTPEETKEALRRAIFHYHPDINIKHGQEWVLLCNEITKFLNIYNTNYK